MSRLSRLIHLRAFAKESFTLNPAFRQATNHPGNEPDNVKRARLFYQSRTRGILENCILISAYANQYLPKMSSEDLKTFDHLLNASPGDWDLYYWISGEAKAPDEFQSKVLEELCEFVSHREKSRFV